MGFIRYLPRWWFIPPTRFPSFLTHKHLMEAIWSLCGGLGVSWSVCAPSNTAIKTHTAQTLIPYTPLPHPPSLYTHIHTHKPEQVWSITLHNRLLPHSHSFALSPSLSLTPSGLIPEFVPKLLSSSSIPCFLGFSQVSNPISPSTQSQQVWINCQAT